MNVNQIHKSWWETEVECNFCKNTAPKKRIILKNVQNKKHDLVECPYCKLRFFEPRLSEVWTMKQKEVPGTNQAAARCYRFGTMMPHGAEPGFDVKKQKEFVKKYFDRIYDEMHMVNKEKEPRILDVGCGVGWSLFHFKVKGASQSSIGVEPSKTAADLARDKLKLNIVELPFSKCSESQLGRFDMVHANDVIEHTYTPFDDLNKMRRLVKYGGVLYLKTFAEDLDEVKGRTMLNPPGHAHHITQEVMKKMLAYSGWKILDFKIHSDVQMAVKALAV